MDSLTSTLLHLLYPLTVDENPDLSEGAINALQALLSTKDGSEIKDESTGLEYEYLAAITKGKKSRKGLNVDFNYDKMESSLEEMIPVEKMSHQEWIVGLVCSILSSFCLNNQLFQTLISISKIKWEVAEAVLPHLIVIITESRSPSVEVIHRKLAHFFSMHYSLANEGSTNEGSSIYLNKASIKTMLSAISLIRKKSDNNLIHIDELNCLHVAKAAQFCSAHFTSILFAELWADSVVRVIKDEHSINIGFSQIDYLTEFKQDDANILEKLLWKGLKEIGEPDSVYAYSSSHLETSCSRIEYYKHLGHWARLINECEVNPSKENNKDLVWALRQSGKFSLAMKASLEKSEYECAWRLGDWSLELSSSVGSYEGLLYSGLQAWKQGNYSGALEAVSQARDVILLEVAHSSLQVATNIYQPLSRLQALRELEDCSNGKILEPWDLDKGMRWLDCEPLLSQCYTQMCQQSDSQLIAKHLLVFATIAESNDSLFIAQRCLENLEKLNVDDHIIERTRLKKAELLWLSGDKNYARALLKPVLTKLEASHSPVLPAALLTYGQWMAESNEENPRCIIEKYFVKAAEKSNKKEDRLMAADCLSRFADNEYQRLFKYTKSSDFQNKVDSAKQRDAQGNLMTNDDGIKTADFRLAARQYTVTANIDLTEMNTVLKHKDFYLLLALKEYLYWLREGEGDLKMFRVISLWEENSGMEVVTKQLTEMFHLIPSYKFLLVLPQLVVKLSDEKSENNKILKSVIKRCCIEHPHHSLPFVMALSNSDKDTLVQETQTKGRKSKQNQDGAKPEVRVRGARILQKELTNCKEVSALIKEMDLLYDAYINLANLATPKGKYGDFKMDESIDLRKIKNFESVCCPTINLPVKRNGKYSNITGICKFDERFTILGGVNLPKKVKCLCTDGVSRHQLVKGKDDLRQDAVMQQVFGILNTLLKADKETSSRKLLIRTYKVIPMSRRSGVLEWCENTEPMSQYLVGAGEEKGAHVRFRPSDMSPNECRSKLYQYYQVKSTPEQKLKTFLKICQSIQPVFRYFFIERFPSPGIWFERRLAYTHSVAASSMIGYILGIGDRHVANILLDKSTAEVIHIDFGIAFEQGLSLNTPELVPFRLTRDVEDGMGVSGTEGVFRRCCEKTMNVLRQYQQPIITALEVLLYDPLYVWTQSAKKKNDRQTQESSLSPSISENSGTEVNLLAERALQRLRDKLQGCEDGCPTSIEGQISRLIQEAKNPSNLSQLYFGWQAYL